MGKYIVSFIIKIFVIIFNTFRDHKMYPTGNFGFRFEIYNSSFPKKSHALLAFKFYTCILIFCNTTKTFEMTTKTRSILIILQCI